MGEYSYAWEARYLCAKLDSTVISDASANTISLAACRNLADNAIDEAARAGNYDVPFGVTSTSSGSQAENTWVRDLSKIGTVAYALRGTAFPMAEAAEPDTAFLEDFDARLALLRDGVADLGTVTRCETVTMPDNESTWYHLGKGALKLASVRVLVGTTVYLEDRRNYEEDYYPAETHHFEVDHVRGLIRALDAGALQSATVVVSYEYYLKQPAPAIEAMAAGRAIETGLLIRRDVGRTVREYEREGEG